MFWVNSKCGVEWAEQATILYGWEVLGNCNLYPKGSSTSVFVEQSSYFLFVARLWSHAVH